MAEEVPARKTPKGQNAMRGSLTDEEIARRNVLPTTTPAGGPTRILAQNHITENDEVVHYKTVDPNEPGPASSEQFKPLVRDEVQKITSRLGHKIVKDDPEYWGIAAIMTEEEAAVTKYMKVRQPVTLEELCKRTGKTAGELQPILDTLSVKGMIEYNWENKSKQKQYVLPMFVPGSAEFTVMNERQLEEHPEMGSLFERMTYLPLKNVTKLVPEGGAGVGMHVIPVERSIEQVNHTVTVEHISHWLKKYDRYAATPCSCRLAERVRGDGCADDPEDWCLAIGDMADYCVETGKGHYITYDEVIDICTKAEKNGFVHQITNIDGEDKIFAICNCNVNVCYALRTSQLFNTPNLSRSAFVAHVDEEKCVACGGCVEVCPAGAPQLGQKLPTRKGKISYPTQDLPDDKFWGESDWDWNYKNNNRIECHDTGTAPCKVACPAHISVQGYLRMAAEGRYRDALELIKKENPFPAVCGRVCNKRCEAACTRGTIDQAVAIDDVKKFIAQKDLEAEHRFIPEPVIPSNRGRFNQKIAIIGAGPAGLSCAYYLAERGYNPVVFEKNLLPGGMMVYGIPSYKLEKNVVAAEIDVLKEMGVEIRCGVEVGKDITLDELRAQGFIGFYVAIGCQGGRKANIAGEDVDGVISAVDFLHFVTEHPLHEVPGKTVVIGGGNVAIDAARVSARCGSESVTMVCLEQPDEMPALPEEITEAQEDGVSIKNGWGPAFIATDEQGHVCGVMFKRCMRVFDNDKRFSPCFDDEQTMYLEADAVVLSIGQTVEWGSLLEGEAVELTRGNFARADSQTYQTAQPDVFVGGDVYTGPRFVIDAIAAGHEAAVSLHRFVQKGSSLTIGRNQRHYVELDKSDAAVESCGYDHAGRQRSACDSVKNIRHNWTDPSHTFTPEQIRIETARCLKCGASIVDANKCIGCGLCTTRCEFDAIHLFRDNPHCSDMVAAEHKAGKILSYVGKRAVKIIKNPARKTKTPKPQSHVTTDELGNPVSAGSTGISS